MIFTVGLFLFVTALSLDVSKQLVRYDDWFAAIGTIGIACMLVSLGILAWRYLP